MEQILSTYVLDTLEKKRPEDALAIIALTASDLWPGEGWNFVFGQASIEERVGVWSLYRNGDPSTAEGFRLCLRRTIKTAVHEASHILSIRHCIAWDCIMNGSNHRQEADSRPLHLCPSCLCMLCWNLRISPIPRHETLAAFCQRQGLSEDAAHFRVAADVMSGK